MEKLQVKENFLCGEITDCNMLQPGFFAVLETVHFILKRQLGTHGNVICIAEKHSACKITLLFYKDSFDL